MEIKVDREKLTEALELVSRISTKHQTLPALQCVLCIASKDEGKLTLKATNLEVGIEVALDAQIHTSATFAVPAALLVQTVQLLAEKSVTFLVEKDTLGVKTFRSHTTITTLPHEEFPNIPQLTGKTQRLHGARFALGIKTAAFATSQSSIKPELGSVFIHQQKEHTLTFVATDAFRLIERVVPQKSVVLDTPILVPCKNALELARVCEVVGEDPDMVVSENQLTLRFERGVYVTTRLTEASFPDYQQIIPKEFSVEATVLRGDLVHALKKTNVFANAYLQVRMKVDPKENLVVCNSDSGELGKTEEAITASVEGAELSLSFNQRYLTDPLGLFTDDSVLMRFAGVGRPMVIEGVSDKTLRYLIMPMNR